MSSDVQAKWMNDVEVARCDGDALELLPQVVLDGLDVVVGLGLERLDAHRVVDAELVDDLVQHVLDRRLERRELDDARLVGEMLQPAHLDQRAVADQRVFGEVFAQRCRFARVAAVERRKCEKRCCVQRAAEAYTSVFGVRIIHREPALRAGSINPRGVGMAADFRVERDSMGELQVPASALWGAQTQRAVNNFPISGLRMPPAFIRALALVKWAAARANRGLGLLPEPIATAIEASALEIANGMHEDQFPIDVFQTGSGTSSNMNANEVIARLATRGARHARARERPRQHEPEQQRLDPVGDPRRARRSSSRRSCCRRSSTWPRRSKPRRARSPGSSRPAART